MTLFWHNHFATSIAKVQRTTLMFNQNRLIREHALGKFGPFLHDMSKDAAMIVWLDNNSNLKSASQRELRPRSHGAVHASASAITPRKTSAKRPAPSPAGTPTATSLISTPATTTTAKRPSSAKPATGTATTFSTSFSSDRTAPSFWFANSIAISSANCRNRRPKLLAPLAEAFRKTDYDIDDLVRRMLSSRHFFSAHAFRQRIKSPVEYVLGAVKTVYEGDRRRSRWCIAWN